MVGAGNQREQLRCSWKSLDERDERNREIQKVRDYLHRDARAEATMGIRAGAGVFKL